MRAAVPALVIAAACAVLALANRLVRISCDKCRGRPRRYIDVRSARKYEEDGEEEYDDDDDDEQFFDDRVDAELQGSPERNSRSGSKSDDIVLLDYSADAESGPVGSRERTWEL